MKEAIDKAKSLLEFVASNVTLNSSQRKHISEGICDLDAVLTKKREGPLKLCFTLTMPNRGSWNGGWSGEKNLYAVVRTFKGRKAKEYAKTLVKSYHYSFGDGWGANVEVKEINTKEAARVRRDAKGFCGYEWMIESIIKRGKILTDSSTP